MYFLPRFFTVVTFVFGKLQSYSQDSFKWLRFHEVSIFDWEPVQAQVAKLLTFLMI